MTGREYDRRELIVLLSMELWAELSGQSTVTVANDIYKVSHTQVLSKHCLGCYITHKGKRRMDHHANHCPGCGTWHGTQPRGGCGKRKGVKYRYTYHKVRLYCLTWKLEDEKYTRSFEGFNGWSMWYKDCIFWIEKSDVTTETSHRLGGWKPSSAGGLHACKTAGLAVYDLQCLTNVFGRQCILLYITVKR